MNFEAVCKRYLFLSKNALSKKNTWTHLMHLKWQLASEPKLPSQQVCDYSDLHPKRNASFCIVLQLAL